jgi:hypothetical protein
MADSRTLRCIYCSKQEQKTSRRRLWPQEHYLSRGLGTFQGSETLLDIICGECNRKIGECEDQFLRSGPIAFMREMCDITGRHESRPSPFYQSASGAKPIEILLPAPTTDYDVLWEIDRGTNDIFPMRQVILSDADGKTRPLPILEREKEPQSLIKLINDNNLEGYYPINSFASDDEKRWVQEVLQEVFPPLQVEWEVMDWAHRRQIVPAKVYATTKFYRAVAKIGFHYVLKNFETISGHENTFDPIKNYILRGISDREFVYQRPQSFVQNFFPHGTNRWMHALGFHSTYNNIVAHCSFFIGPTFLGLNYDVCIGNNPSRIDFSQQKAHLFVYLFSDSPTGYSGEMEEVDTLKYVIPVK